MASAGNKRLSKKNGRAPLENDNIKLLEKTTIPYISSPTKIVASKHNVNLETALNEALKSNSQTDALLFFQQLTNCTESLSQKTLDGALVESCKQGNKFLAKSILYCSVNINCRDASGNTPLMICASKNYCDIARALLHKKADVNCANKNGDTALILSINSSGSADMVDLLLSQKSVNIFHTNSEGTTCLMKAVQLIDFELIRMILSKAFSSGKKKSRYKKFVSGAKGIAAKVGIPNVFRQVELEISQSNQALFTAASESDLESVHILLNFELSERKSSSEHIIINKLLDYYERKHVITEKDIEIVQLLISKDKDFTLDYSFNYQFLVVAVNIGNCDLLELICQFVDKGYRKDNYYLCMAYRNALTAVSLKCRCDLLNILVKYRPNIISSCEQPTDFLAKALETGDTKFVDLFLTHDILFNTEFGLILSIKSGQIKSLNFILERLQSEARSIIRNSSCGLLHASAEVGSEEIVKRLIDLGVDVNGVFENKTPLMCCSNTKAATLLLQNGANVNCKVGEHKMNALIYLFKGQENFEPFSENDLPTKKELLSLFMQYGANILEKDSFGRNVIICVSKIPIFSEILLFLLNSGADSNQCDNEGKTALHWAVCYNCLKNVEILLDFNADVNLKTYSGKTSLLLAAEFSAKDIFDLLVRHGADVNSEDLEGNTPLMSILKWDNVEALRGLIKAGADVNHKNSAGFTALMLASLDKYMLMVTELCENGADVNYRLNSENVIDMMVKKYACNSFFTREKHMKFLIYLLDHGGIAENVQAEHVLPLITEGNMRLLQKLIYAGMSPFECQLKDCDQLATDFLMLSSISPFSFALLNRKFTLAKYFASINFLTTLDFSYSYRIQLIRFYLNKTHQQEGLDFFENFYSTTMPLERLCLINISSAVGPGMARVEKVRKLPIPKKLQDQILFQADNVMGAEVEDEPIEPFIIIDDHYVAHNIDYYDDFYDSVNDSFDDSYDNDFHYDSDYI